MGKFVVRGIFAVAILSLFLFPVFSSAEIYQWKDSSGNVFFTDSPPAGVQAEEKRYREDRIERHETKEPASRRKSAPAAALRDYGDVQVIMYMTTWCPYCIKAREYINSLGVRLTEYDIDKDKNRNAEMSQKSGRKGVPVIDVEGIIIRGYSPDGIKQAVEKRRKT